MVIALQCGCGRKINAPDRLAGQNARCPYCGKSVPVPAAGHPPAAPPPATIAVSCPCGKNLKAPATLAGKSAKCPGCGNKILIPAVPGPEIEITEAPAVAPPPPEPEEAPAGPAPRGRFGARGRKGAGAPARGRIRREAGPMPGLATGLAVLSLIESLGVGLFAIVFILAGGLFAAATHGLGDGGKSLMDAMAEGTVEEVRSSGGRITRDEVILDAQGRKMRQIEYVQADGSKGSVGFPVGDQEAAAVKGMGTAVGGIVIMIGVALGVCALGKLLCAIGFFMKKNWGRVGLVALSGFESAVILLAVLGGGASALVLGTLIVNLGVVFYFLTGGVKQACR